MRQLLATLLSAGQEHEAADEVRSVAPLTWAARPCCSLHECATAPRLTLAHPAPLLAGDSRGRAGVDGVHCLGADEPAAGGAEIGRRGDWVPSLGAWNHARQPASAQVSRAVAVAVSEVADRSRSSEAGLTGFAAEQMIDFVFIAQCPVSSRACGSCRAQAPDMNAHAIVARRHWPDREAGARAERPRPFRQPSLPDL